MRSLLVRPGPLGGAPPRPTTDQQQRPKIAGSVVSRSQAAWWRLPVPQSKHDPVRSGERDGRRRILSHSCRALRHDAAGWLRRRSHQVESPAGDDTRTVSPPERDGVSTYYLAIHRPGPQNPDDLVAAHQIAVRADIPIENFEPGGLVRFGLDHDTGPRPPTPSSMPLSAASAAAPGPRCPATTCSCRPCPG